MSIDLCAQSPEEEGEMKDVPYRSALGALLFIANTVRPDLSYAMSQLGRFAANPGRMAWKQMKHVMRYLSATKHWVLRYGVKMEGVPMAPLVGYCDAAWASDVKDRKSHTGYLFMSYGGPVQWRSTRQKCLALSSCESELVAASECAKELVWLNRVMRQDFGHKKLGLPMRDMTMAGFRGKDMICVYEDNTGVIALSRNRGVLMRRSKHIELKHFYCRDLVQQGVMILSYCPTQDMLADLLTKAVGPKVVSRLRARLLAEWEQPVEPPTGKSEHGF